MGDYEVTVTDANNCKSTAVYTIEEDTDFEILSNILETQPCPGSYLGEIIIGNSSGGTEPYNYTWSTGEIGPQLENLVAGSYTVTISAADACMDEQTIVLANDDPSCNDNGVDCEGLDIISNIFEIAPCTDQSNGALYVFNNTGTEVLSYQWSNGETGASITNIPAGEYCVTVTLTNGCFETECTLLKNGGLPNPLSISLVSTSSSGPIVSNGSIDATVSGGNGPFAYFWSGPNGFTSFTEDLTGLLPGEYCLNAISTGEGEGCYSGYACVTVEDECSELIIIGVQHHGFIPCEGDKGQLTVW